MRAIDKMDKENLLENIDDLLTEHTSNQNSKSRTNSMATADSPSSMMVDTNNSSAAAGIITPSVEIDTGGAINGDLTLNNELIGFEEELNFIEERGN